MNEMAEIKDIESKIYKKIETLHQFPQLRGSAKCLHFIIMLN